VLTFLSLLNVTPGTVSGWWAGFLRRLFGWGAFPVALALGAGGVILLAHNLQPGSIIGWKMVIGLEFVFLAGLALAHLLSPNPDSLQLAHNGRGGGYVGWAISNVLSQALGSLMAFPILLATAIAGLILIFDLSISQTQRGLTSAWKTSLSFYRHLRSPAVTKEGTDMTTARIRKLHRRQRRKRKLRHLRRRLAEAKGPDERRQLIAKMRRISPYAPVCWMHSTCSKTNSHFYDRFIADFPF